MEAATSGSTRHVFDSLDRELISLLRRRDGRAPLSRLATILGVSRGTVQNRLDRLISSAAILAFSVREDYGLDTIRALMPIEVSGRSTMQVIRQLRGSANWWSCTPPTPPGT